MNAKEMKEYQDKVLVVLSDGHIGFNEEEIEVIRDVLAVGG